jgi:hypothetical protein
MRRIEACRSKAYRQLSAEYISTSAEPPAFAHILDLILKKEEKQYSAKTPRQHNPQ